MLRALGVKSVKLMTNNPGKVTGLRERSITVAGRIPIVIAPNRHNAEYLRKQAVARGTGSACCRRAAGEHAEACDSRGPGSHRRDGTHSA